jgi:hypothetical protein
MSKKGRDRRQKSNKERGPRPSRPPRPENSWQPDCPVCGKAVRNINIAIEEKKSKQPAHFECIMRILGEEIALGPRERLHYLGSGCFGVVKLEEGKGLSSYSIVKRIQYEDSDNKADWRKKIFQHVNK